MSNFDFSRVTAAEQPRNNAELMVDIETLGTRMGAPILTIGATIFDPYASDSGEELMRRAILIRFDIAEAVRYAEHVDGNTLRWWFEQEDAALKALVGKDTMTVREGLKLLYDYCHDRGAFMNDAAFDGITEFPKCNRFWAKDPDFDMRLMEHYYSHPDIPFDTPWKFWSNRSVRTVQDLAWPSGDRPDFDVKGGVAHDARWDAVTQAMMVQAAMRRLGIAQDQDVRFSAWEGND